MTAIQPFAAVRGLLPQSRALAKPRRRMWMLKARSLISTAWGSATATPWRNYRRAGKVIHRQTAEPKEAP